MPYAIIGAMALNEFVVELKLASGMTAPHRLKDLADVQELIRIRQLPRAFVEGLNTFVRATYLELWQSVQNSTTKPREGGMSIGGG